ncbi:MAG: hypothetical protein IJV05_05525 [Muribaculaceae bacterium]|nr:hypothetical protein [Muribaculaceae bacterium]
MRARILAILTIIAVFTALTAGAQEPDKRHVTPVKPETNRVQPPPKGTDEKVIQQYISGDSTAAVQEARKDSLRRVYKRYPLLTDLTVGINVADPLFMIFGQSYASADVNATLNMWNRLQPTIELGLGWANSTPDDLYFTYRGKPSPYVKVGANYNFMFKNSPDYQALLGFRLGYSTFRYDITDIMYHNSYWDELISTDITGERSHALWGELGVGLKVKLWNRLSMGWMIRYHNLFDYGKSEHSKPWFIPGYGPRNSSLGFSLGLYYTLPMHRTASATTATQQ